MKGNGNKGTEMDSIVKISGIKSDMYGTFLPSLRNFRWYLTRRNCMHLHKKGGRRIGIVYESHYHLMVVDVVRAKKWKSVCI